MAFTTIFALSNTRRLLSPCVSWPLNAPLVSSNSVCRIAFQIPCTSSGGSGIYSVSTLRLWKIKQINQASRLTIFGYDHINENDVVPGKRST